MSRRCDGCGADMEQNQDHDRGCPARRRAAREPGAIGGEYMPEVGDIVQVEGRGYGMVSRVGGVRF